MLAQWPLIKHQPPGPSAGEALWVGTEGLLSQGAPVCGDGHVRVAVPGVTLVPRGSPHRGLRLCHGGRGCPLSPHRPRPAQILPSESRDDVPVAPHGGSEDEAGGEPVGDDSFVFQE